jgi:Bacterial Ig domain
VRAAQPGGSPDPTPASSTFTVQSSPPPSFPPSAPVIMSPGNYSWVNTNAVTITGTATAGSTVEILESGRSLGTTTANAAGSWSRQVNVPDGAQLFTATATTMGGTSDQTPIRVVQVDTKAPAAPVFTAPQEGGSVPSSFTVGGTAESGVTIELFENGQSRGTIAASGGQWSRAMSGVTSGTRVYTARATDFAGNVSTTSPPRTVVVG